MKITIICSLMSGFRSSVTSGRWSPTGAPAFAQLLSQLSCSEHRVKVFFTDRQGFVNKDNTLLLDGLSIPITILSGINKIPKIFSRFQIYLSELRQIIKAIIDLKKNSPDVVYIDRGNVLLGAIASRFMGLSVVVRILGVTPEMFNLLTQNRISHFIYRWAYRSPFSLVIATMDGSPAKAWMNRALRPNIPRKILLNGVDGSVTNQVLPIGDRKIKIIFVGRLESLKGIEEFIAGLIALPATVKERLAVSVVGDGSLRKTVRQQLIDNDARAMVTFHNALTHPQVHSLLSESDIYVSLNKQGNLSNANLEAIKHHLCIIIPDGDQQSGRDVDTMMLLPRGSAIRLPSNDIQKALTQEIENLVADPELIIKYQQAVEKCSGKIKTWAERINFEIELFSTSSVLSEVGNEKKALL